MERHLARTLSPGDYVILGNLSSHKVAGIRETIEARGAQVMDMPTYSPDINPVELAFAKVKALLRRAEGRTIDGFWSRVGQLLNEFSPTECRNYVHHCGYGSTPR